MGAGIAGVGTGAGRGARKRGAWGTGAGGAALRTSRSLRDLSAVGIALGQVLLNRRLSDHIGRSVKHHRPVQVDSEVPREVGRRLVESCDHDCDRHQVIQDGSHDPRRRFWRAGSAHATRAENSDRQIIEIGGRIIQISGPVGFHVLPSVFSTRR